MQLTEKILVHYPIEVTGDLNQLYRLISNLIVNAIQYIPTKGKVEVILNVTESQALIEITSR